MVGERGAVAGAGPGLVDYDCGRLGESDRQIPEVGGQIVGLVEHVGGQSWRGGELAGQVGEGLVGGEHVDLDQGPAVTAQAGVAPPGGDDDLPARTLGPQAVQIGGVGQIVQDQEP